MRYPNRSTLCVSSQAGCGMACPFCATGQLGLTRNLSTAEIVEQVRCGGQVAGRRRAPRRPVPAVQPRVHGHGRADGELQGRPGDRPAAGRPGARRPGHVRAQHHRLDRGPRAGDRAAHRGGHPGDPRGVAARPRRRAARRARPDQHPLERRRRRSTPRAATSTSPDAGCPSSTRSSGTSTTTPGARTCWARSSTPAARAGCTATRSRSTRRPGPSGPRATPPSSRSSWTGCVPTAIPTTIRDTRGSDIDGACGQLAAEEDPAE